MPSVEAIAEMYANRLRKNARHRHKWARAQVLEAYRLYDQDIPEVPVTVDWYHGACVIADVRAFTGEDPDRDATWMEAMLDATAAALAIAPSELFVKRRERMRQRQEGRQYERNSDAGALTKRKPRAASSLPSSTGSSIRSSANRTPSPAMRAMALRSIERIERSASCVTPRTSALAWARLAATLRAPTRCWPRAARLYSC